MNLAVSGEALQLMTHEHESTVKKLRCNVRQKHQTGQLKYALLFLSMRKCDG
jgi:hypothetical protein